MRQNSSVQHFLVYRGEIVPCRSAVFSLTSAPPELRSRTSNIREPSAFTTFRTFPTQTSESSCRVLGFSRHLQRVVENAVGLEILPAANQDAVLETICDRAQRIFAEEFPHSTKHVPQRIRVIIRSAESFELSIEALSSDWDSLDCVALVSIDSQRLLPQFKSTATETSRYAREKAKSLGANEALLTDSGKVREGAWSNFFYFNSQGNLCTPAESVLPGITRELILRAHACELRNLAAKDIPSQVHSAFVTNATSGILPVSRIDSHELQTSAQVEELQRWYSKLVEKEAEEISRPSSVTRHITDHE